jgi:hypothetical protein
VQVHRAKDAIRARGAEIFLLGNGAPGFVQAFREDTLVDDVAVLTDPTLETYRTLSFKRGVRDTLLSPRTWSSALRATREGHRQGRVKGDAWQLGGVLVVRPGGEVVFRHASQSAGDHPPVEAILAALDAPAERAAGAPA